MKKRSYTDVSCAYCGKKKTIRNDSVKNKNYCNASCSQKDRLRKPEDHPSWKGGRRINHHGYIEIYNPKHHRSRGNGYVFEHIIVAENKLGRKIGPHEHVHHINKNKTDNREENLLVLSDVEHGRLHGKEKGRNGVNKKCMRCNKQFYCKPSHISKRKYCSKTCAALAQNLPKSREIKISEEQMNDAVNKSKSVKEASIKLGIHYSTLYKKLKKSRSAS